MSSSRQSLESPPGRPELERAERARRVVEEEGGGDSNDCRDDDMADQVCAAASIYVPANGQQWPSSRVEHLQRGADRQSRDPAADRDPRPACMRVIFAAAARPRVF